MRYRSKISRARFVVVFLFLFFLFVLGRATSRAVQGLSRLEDEFFNAEDEFYVIFSFFLLKSYSLFL